MEMLKGITVTLFDKIKSGVDGFGAPIYEEKAIRVKNVLVSPATSTDILESTNLYGKKAVYTLAIPKRDKHIWEDRRVDFFGESWHVFGYPTKGIDENIPLDWNMKVMVERYG